MEENNKRALEDIDTTPTEGMVEEAKKGLEWRREFGRGGTIVGVSRARDIKNRKELSPRTVKRMFSFFSRHEIDKKAEGFRPGEEGYPSNGRIAWALWGGDPGFAWSKRKVKEIKAEEERQLTGAVKKALEKKVEDHNEEIKDLNLKWNARVTLAKLEKVFDRGVGAYKTNPGSVRPSVNSPEQWAYARVNSFLYALKKGKYRSGKHDTDLLPKDHPVRIEMDKKMIIMDKIKRELVGTLITDGIELPLYTTKEEAEEIAEKMGGSGAHEHTIDGETYYMPFDSHEEIKEALTNKLRKDLEEEAEEDLEESYLHEEEEMKSLRSNPKKEIRTFSVEDLELRMDHDEKRVIGYGAVFNSLSNDLGGFREYISKEAFEGRLEDDVRFLINHDGLPLARTTNGTLRLSVDEKGLRYEADMPDTTLSNDLMELLKNGTINQSSFAFIVEDDSWEVKDGVNIRTINKISRLFDVSAVTYPAYEEASSSVALRSLEEWKNSKLEEGLEKDKNERMQEEQDLHKRNLAELKLKKFNY